MRTTTKFTLQALKRLNSLRQQWAIYGRSGLLCVQEQLVALEASTFQAGGILNA